MEICQMFNPFVSNAPFLYPIKTSKNRFLRDRERMHWEWMGWDKILQTDMDAVFEFVFPEVHFHEIQKTKVCSLTEKKS